MVQSLEQGCQSPNDRFSVTYDYTTLVPAVVIFIISATCVFLLEPSSEPTLEQNPIYFGSRVAGGVSLSSILFEIAGVGILRAFNNENSQQKRKPLLGLWQSATIFLSAVFVVFPLLEDVVLFTGTAALLFAVFAIGASRLGEFQWKLMLPVLIGGLFPIGVSLIPIFSRAGPSKTFVIVFLWIIAAIIAVYYEATAGD
jgi:hypothetical protein